MPTCVRWAEHDPLFPYAWTDRLGETFANLDLAMFPDVGHFPASRGSRSRGTPRSRRSLTRIGWRLIERHGKSGTARRDKTPAVPCRFIEILAGKCGFAGQRERRNDGSNAREIGNANPILT